MSKLCALNIPFRDGQEFVIPWGLFMNVWPMYPALSPRQGDQQGDTSIQQAVNQVPILPYHSSVDIEIREPLKWVSSGM